jgi:hypothetical protein
MLTIELQSLSVAFITEIIPGISKPCFWVHAGFQNDKQPCVDEHQSKQ